MMIKDMITKRVKMNPYKLTSVDSLMRSFFKEAIYQGWSFRERSIIFNLCKGRSCDFEDLLSVLRQYIDQIDSEYSEPAPIKSNLWDTGIDLNSDDAEFFIYQFSLTEDFKQNSLLITDTDDFIRRFKPCLN